MNTEERLDRLEKAIDTAGTARRRAVYIFVAIGFLVGCGGACVSWSAWDAWKVYVISQLNFGVTPHIRELVESVRRLCIMHAVFCVVVSTAVGFVVGRLWNR